MDIQTHQSGLRAGIFSLGLAGMIFWYACAIDGTLSHVSFSGAVTSEAMSYQRGSTDWDTVSGAIATNELIDIAAAHGLALDQVTSANLTALKLSFAGFKGPDTIAYYFDSVKVHLIADDMGSLIARDTFPLSTSKAITVRGYSASDKRNILESSTRLAVYLWKNEADSLIDTFDVQLEATFRIEGELN